MIDSPLAARRGSQRPRLEHVPLWVTTAADDAVDFCAEVAGLELDDWQEYVFRNALGERESGRWSAFEVAVVVPRQNGKNIILEARELAGVFLFGEQLVIHSAHEASTAGGAFADLKRRFQNHPDLLREVRGFREDLAEDPDKIGGFKLGNNDRSIELRNGAKIVYKTRTPGGGRGLTGDLVILDEAYALKHDHISALMPTMSARTQTGNPQLWYTSSAGMPDSEVLANLRDRYITGEGAKHLAGFEWSAPTDELDSDSEDLEAAYMANPSLGTHISHEYVFEVERPAFQSGESTGGIEGWRRERLGIWATLGGDPLFAPEEWAAGITKDPVDPENPIAFALDIPPARDVATLCAASALQDGRVRFEVVDRFDNFHVIPERLKALQEKWNPVAIVVDAMSGAATMIDELRRARVRTRQLNGKEYVEACSRLYDVIKNGNAVHSNQRELNDAIAAADRKVRPNSSTWVWARKDITFDISPLIGCTLALHGLTKFKDRQNKTEERLVFI